MKHHLIKPSNKTQKSTNLTYHKKAKTILLVVSIITGFIFIVAFSTLYVSDAIKNNNACGCVIPIPFMILILSSLGLFIGTLVYYLLSSKIMTIERQCEINRDNLLSTLNFLERDERSIVKVLIEHDGVIKQAKLSNLIGMDKVKLHRLIKRLEQKGVITKKRKGKINIINLNKSINEVFCKK